MFNKKIIPHFHESGKVEIVFVTKWYESTFTTLKHNGLTYIEICVDFVRSYLFETKTLCLPICMGVMKKIGWKILITEIHKLA